MTFTMKYTAHPQRKTAFTKAVEASGRIHALIPKASPWRNGIIERSNRTDKEECLERQRFQSSEERRYYFKLWEAQYNYERPHQGIGNQTPVEYYRRHYPLHAATRMLEPLPRAG
jgi:transposase InsO family protein